MNFRNYLNKIGYYFKDSYGLDKFSKFLVITGVILSTGRYIWIAGYALIIYGLWRAVSKNKYKRYQELCVFESYLMLWKQRFFRSKAFLRDYPNYKIFKCPNCSQKLRVPRKKGRLVITCKKCGTEFKGKS